MKKYEIMYIVSVSLEEEARENVHERVKTILENNDAQISETDHIGVKRFAYEINHQNEGDYMVIDFEAEPSVISEINNDLRITDGLVRHMIVNLED